MRAAVPCFGRLRSLSFATGAALGFSLACGGSGGSGLFSDGGAGPSTHTGGVIGSGGSQASGGSAQGASTSGGTTASGGNISVSGGQSSGGSPSSGGSTQAGGTPSSGGSDAMSGGKAVGGGSSGGATSGGAASGGDSTGGVVATSGGTSVGGTVSGGVASGGAASGGAVSGGTLSTGGVPAGGAGSGGESGGSPSTGGVASGGSGGASGGVGGCSSKQTERCDGIDNDCDTMVDETGACPAKCTGFALDGHGYMVCDVAVGATKASTLCEDQGLRLAWIESADENAALLKFIASIGNSGRGGAIPEVSIGATDAAKEGQWHWVDGADFWQGAAKGSAVDGAYVNWGNGRPNNTAIGSLTGEDCAVLVIDQPDDGEPGQWNDVACSEPYAVLCETP